MKKRMAFSVDMARPASVGHHITLSNAMTWTALILGSTAFWALVWSVTQ